MCADHPCTEDRFDLFGYRRMLRRGAGEPGLGRLRPSSLAAIAAAIFTAVGVAAWLGPDMRVGLAKETSQMWDFIRQPSSADLSAAAWHDAPSAAAPLLGDADPARPQRHAGRKTARRAAKPAVGTAPGLAGRAVCVRLCDGFFFPLGDIQKASDLPDQEAICHSLCPGAPTHAYVVPSGADTIDRAASRDGHLYSALPVAFRHTRTADDACTCHAAPAPNEALLRSLMRDVTLRRGDAVATDEGVRVFKGATHWPYQGKDFLSLVEAGSFEPKSTALVAIDRALRQPQPASSLALSLVLPPRKARPKATAALTPDFAGRRSRGSAVPPL